MTVLEFIESEVLEAALNLKELEEIILDEETFRKLLKEMSSMTSFTKNSTQYLNSQNLTFNSIYGPIEIKRGKVKKDPNSILKEIL